MSGAIIRVKKNKSYFSVSNQPFNDERLSWEARGLMGYLLSKPDDWECRNEDLIDKGPAGRDKVTRMLKELKDAGYLRRYRERVGGGLFDWVTEIYESPDLNPDLTGPNLDEEPPTIPGKSGDGETIPGKPVNGSTIPALTVDGSTVNGKGVDILSTESLSTESLKTKRKNHDDDNAHGRDGLDPDFGLVCKTYENEIGKLTPYVNDELQDLYDTYPPGWIIEAIQVAARQNARRLSYICSVLENRAAGIQKPAAAPRKGQPNGHQNQNQTTDDELTRRGFTPTEIAQLRAIESRRAGAVGGG